MIKTWIPEEDIKNIFNIELLSVFLVLALTAYIFYKLFLKKISEKRHKNLQTRFKKLPIYFLFLAILLMIGWLNELFPDLNDVLVVRKIESYVLLFGFLVSAYILVRIFQILIYCYLFFANMRIGIPRLLANVLTFVFSVILFGLMGNYLFKINLAAIGATSAVFSIILGLALQDTIGNLFAGLSLQIDKSLKIGDWVEIFAESDSWTGQIQEITWRSTYLIGFSEEIYMVPNRLMASAKVIFQVQDNKSRRLSHMFRFSYSEDFIRVKELMSEAVNNVKSIDSTSAVRVLLLETQESWIRVGVFYTIEDYSLRYRIGDQVIQSITSALASNKIEVQCPKLNGEISISTASTR